MPAIRVNTYRPHQEIGLHPDDEDYEEPLFVVCLESMATLRIMEFDLCASSEIHLLRHSRLVFRGHLRNVAWERCIEGHTSPTPHVS